MLPFMVQNIPRGLFIETEIAITLPCYGIGRRTAISPARAEARPF